MYVWLRLICNIWSKVGVLLSIIWSNVIRQANELRKKPLNFHFKQNNTMNKGIKTNHSLFFSNCFFILVLLFSFHGFRWLSTDPFYFKLNFIPPSVHYMYISAFVVSVPMCVRYYFRSNCHLICYYSHRNRASYIETKFLFQWN